MHSDDGLDHQNNKKHNKSIPFVCGTDMNLF